MNFSAFFPFSSALHEFSQMRFSPPHVIFTIKQENTKCPEGFRYALWHSRNWPKIKCFRPVITNILLQTLLNLFLVLLSIPQTNSSMEEAITSLSGTLPVAFHGCVSPISPKTWFFHTKCVHKRTPTAFLVDITSCSRTL